MNKPVRPGISIIIPSYNPGKYISEAIESILNQTLQPAEVIVVSDGSNEESVNIMRSYQPGVTVIYQEHRGAAAARNEGINSSSGEFLAFLDADDYWSLSKLELQIAWLENHPEYDMVFGNVEQFISPELPEESTQNLRQELVRMPGLSAGTLLIRRDTFMKVGLFNESFELGDFIDWFSRATHLGLKHYIFQDVMLYRRIHLNNLGLKRRDRMKDYTSILREALARKRLQG
jgi:glycosyltransferase involved in cell wall biosynthesis